MNSLSTALIISACFLALINTTEAGEMPFLGAKEAKQILTSQRSAKVHNPRQVPEIDDGWEEMFITYQRAVKDIQVPRSHSTTELHHVETKTNQMEARMDSPNGMSLTSDMISLSSHMTAPQIPLPSLQEKLVSSVPRSESAFACDLKSTR